MNQSGYNSEITMTCTEMLRVYYHMQWFISWLLQHCHSAHCKIVYNNKLSAFCGFMNLTSLEPLPYKVQGKPP